MIRKILSVILFLLFLQSGAFAATKSVEISWDNNIEEDLAGYELYVSVNGADLESQDVPHTVSDSDPVVVERTLELPDNQLSTVCAQVLAYDTSANNSAKCDQVCITIDLEPPDTPSGLQMLIQKIIAFIKDFFNRLFS